MIAGGSPHDPISRSLALDLERRGFVVCFVVNSIEDEEVVVNEGRGDIKPLNIDILDVCSHRGFLCCSSTDYDRPRTLKLRWKDSLNTY